MIYNTCTNQTINNVLTILFSRSELLGTQQRPSIQCKCSTNCFLYRSNLGHVHWIGAHYQGIVLSKLGVPINSKFSRGA